jgi:hypothetical protein
VTAIRINEVPKASWPRMPTSLFSAIVTSILA